MPEGMHFPFNANIWLPTGTMPPAITGQPRQARGYFAVGRLNDGVTVEQARAELKTIGATWLRSIRRPTRTSGRTPIPSSSAFSARRSRCSSGR